jgi:uncharacterized protein (TIGR00369 family)
MAAMTAVELQVLLDEVDAPYIVEGINDDVVSLRLPGANAHIRPGGTVSGPALMALADGTAWAALLCRIGINMAAVSTSLHIDFLRRPDAADVVGEGLILRLGKSLAVIEVAMHSAGDRALVAKAQVTYALPRQPERGSSSGP